MGGLRTVLARLRRRRHPNAERPIARMLRVLITKADKLSVLLTLAGLLGLLLLPLTERRAKFDEKSLLVGAAVPTFRCVETGKATAAQQGLLLAILYTVTHSPHSAPQDNCGNTAWIRP